MPTESRILDFSQNEIYEALLAYCRQTRRELPEQICTGLILSQNNETKIALSMNHSDSNITQKSEIRVTLNFVDSQSTFSESEVGGALVMHCMKRGIPMAKRAVKSLEVSREGAHLHLKMDGKAFRASN